jgi:chaperonin GroES
VNECPVKPFDDRVVLLRLDEPSPSSIIAQPETWKQISQRCVVLEVGPGRLAPDGQTRLPMNSMVGAIVYIGRFTGTDLKIGGEELVICHDAEVYCEEVPHAEGG